jgi:hypothetical protein
MTYQEFNLKVLEFYLARSTSAFCNLSIDSRELQSIISPVTFGNFSILRNDWSSLVNARNKPPQYFGLIAIQCYAASLMQAEGYYSAGAYQIRLRQLLGLDSDNDLQQLFRGGDKSNPIQEEMWHRAKNYLKAEHKLKLDIPAKTINAGRFVQYPKSQSLLNTEDLKGFTIFFDQEFKIKEAISFDFFKRKLSVWLKDNRPSDRITSLFSDSNKYEQCCKQVYNYYNSWNGEVYNHTTSNRLQATLSKAKSSLLLLFKNRTPQFYITSESETKAVRPHEILSLRSHNYFHEGITIFKELEYYPDEYEEARFLIVGNSSYILIDKISNRRHYETLEKFHSEKIEITKDLLLYKIKVEKSLLKSSLAAFLTTAHPIVLYDGLKVNRKNEYLKGFGPQIISTNDFAVFIDNKKCDYDPETSESGLYQIRTANYPDIRFLILEKADHSQLIPSRFTGWNLNSMNIQKEYHIEGCFFINIFLHNDKIGRSWIRMNIGLEKKYSGENILLKAIKNSLK